MIWIASFLSLAHAEPETIHVHGRLMDIMHQGQIGTVVNTEIYSNTAHVYGLGAVSELDGEILIWDSKTYVSQERNGQVIITEPTTVNATLLVTTEVDSWDTIKIPKNIQTPADLDQFIQETLQNSSHPLEGPLPFQVRGTFNTVDWHVIHWPEGDTEHTHEKHVTSGAHGSSERIKGSILGFYSQNHTGVFTHHTTNLHMHFIDNQQTLIGHVDDLRMGKRLTLWIPKSTIPLHNPHTGPVQEDSQH